MTATPEYDSGWDEAFAAIAAQDIPTDHPDAHWDRTEGTWNNTPTPQPHVDPESPYINWGDFWQRDRTEADFLIDSVIVRGRGHAIYAKHKTGKSLFSLWAAATVATGPEQAVVIYLDYEMTEDDLQERLEDMGYGPDTDLCRLRYCLLPTLPPLNTPHGATALCDLVDETAKTFAGHHIVVIIDTTSRAVSGEENDSGPYQDFYRYTGLRLKQRGVTWVRLDHEGKDSAKGQRGSSAKGDDIDVAWKVTQIDDGIRLARELSRISWVPERVTYTIGNEPLRYVRTQQGYPSGTEACAAALDRLNITVDVSGNQAQHHLRDAGDPYRREVVLAAVRYRKEQHPDTETGP